MSSGDKVINIREEIMIRELKDRLGYGENESTSKKSKQDNANERKCIFCGNRRQLLKYMGKYYCYSCYQELQQIRKP